MQESWGGAVEILKVSAVGACHGSAKDGLFENTNELEKHRTGKGCVKRLFKKR